MSPSFLGQTHILTVNRGSVRHGHIQMSDVTDVHKLRDDRPMSLINIYSSRYSGSNTVMTAATVTAIHTKQCRSDEVIGVNLPNDGCG